jgi:hypothetical protein
MTLDEALLAEVTDARNRLDAVEDAAYEARARFHQAVRRLHAAGGSMREIATALAMSHQRVHQIIGEDAIVEVEASSSEITPHPAVAASVAVTATEDACSFCGAPRRELDKLLAAAGNVFVCNGCVTRARRALAVSGGAAGEARRAAVRCSFCGTDVTESFEEGGIAICEACVQTCERLLSSDGPRRTAMRRSAKVRCSFCNASTGEVSRMIAGPRVYVCAPCVAAALGVASTGIAAPGPRTTMLRPAAPGEPHPCSFCSQTVPRVASIVKGGRARICNECVEACQEIVAEGA